MHIEDAWVRYRRRGSWVLAGADLAVAAGETVVVAGRNGAGKSTLLQLAAGVLRPDRGSVLGRPAVVGWVPERFPADQPGTVRGYLRSMAAVRGMTRPDRDIGYWAERLAFERYLNERLAALSKGTAQKVGLAQALLVRPGLLVLDEPWEGLDAQTRDQVPAIVAEVLATGGRVLLSDHRGEVARLPSATLVQLDGGRIRPAVEPAPLPARRGPGPAGHGAGPDGRRWVVEVAVTAPDPGPAMAWLHAAGYEVLGAREEAGR